jgi:hypothetical protein
MVEAAEVVEARIEARLEEELVHRGTSSLDMTSQEIMFDRLQ